MLQVKEKSADKAFTDTQYSEIRDYASFIIQNFKDEAVRYSFEKAKEHNLPVFSIATNTDRIDQAVYDEWEQNFVSFLSSLENEKSVSTFNEQLEKWKLNQLPASLNKYQVKIPDFSIILNVRKSTLIYFLKEYNCNQEQFFLTLTKIDEFFNHCTSACYDTYYQIRNEYYLNKANMVEQILKNIPVIVSRVRKDGIIESSFGSGLKLLGLKPYELSGKNVFELYPHSVYLKEVQKGKALNFKNHAIDKRGFKRYFNNFFIPEKKTGDFFGISIDITEAHKIKEELEESQLLLVKIAQSSPSLLCLLNLEQQSFIYINKNLGEELGYSSQIDFTSYEKVFELIHEEDLPNLSLKNKMDCEIADGEIIYDTFRIKDVAGNYRWFWSNALVFKRDKDNLPVEIVCNMQDISFLKESEKELLELNKELENRIFTRTSQLQQSLEKFQVLMDTMPQIAWTALPDGKVEYLNPQWNRYTGSDELPSEENLYSFFHIEDISFIKEEWERSKSLGKGFSIEARIKNHEGKYRWHLLYLKPVKSKQGDVHLWLGTGTDIHNQKESEQHFRFLAESVPQIVYTANDSGKIDYYNERAYNYTGMSIAELMDWNWVNIIHPDDIPHVIKNWQQCLKNGTTYQSEVRLFRLKDNSYRWHLDRALPMKNAEGKIVKWFGTITDIHDQKMVEEELKNKNKELLKINADLDNFVYTASHDLKAPITNIEGLMQILKEHISGNHNQEVQKVFGLVNDSVKKFKNTILELTEISKIQKNNIDDVIPINLEKMLSEIELSIDDSINKSGAVIVKQLQGCPEVTFSKKNLRSVLYNLLSNAIKYRSPDRSPHIVITSEVKDNKAVISFVDNGLGIEASQQPKVFKMFKRLHDHVEGNGIGLYIVNQVLENAGGQVFLSSEPNKGSTFTIHIPLIN